MINNTKLILFLNLCILLLFSSCENVVEPKGKNYALKECQQELLESQDYHEKNSIDLIVVDKKRRQMYLYKNNKIQSTLSVSLGKNPIGTKVREGDNKTPEGAFWISRKLCSSKYYRSLCISYPRSKDIANAKARGVNPGGNITIHAQPKWNADGHRDKYMLSHNWTEGCMAVTNKAMNQLWYAVHEGVPVVIR